MIQVGPGGKEVSILIQNENGSAESTADLKDQTGEKRAWRNRAGDWKTYAAAAGATLAMATNASADIVYSGPVDITVSVPSHGPSFSTKAFTINGFYAAVGIRSDVARGRRRASAALFGSLGVADSFGLFGTPFLRRYSAGQNINAMSLSFGGYLRGAEGRRGVVTDTIGAFGPGTATGFVGFETFGGDLGWIQVKVSSDSSGFPDEAEVIDYAYNSVPGGAITAGEIATPEPSAVALGLLTIGAAGLLAWRRRRAEVAAK